MNLPKNIHETDGAIARSFSRELGLNLDFKTNREILWVSGEHAAPQHVIGLDDKHIICTVSNGRVGVWDKKTKKLIRSFNHPFEKTKKAFALENQKLLLVPDLGRPVAALLDVQTGKIVISPNKVARGSSDVFGQNFLYSTPDGDVLLATLPSFESEVLFSGGQQILKLRISNSGLFAFIQYKKGDEKRARIVALNSNKAFRDMSFNFEVNDILELDDNHDLVYQDYSRKYRLNIITGETRQEGPADKNQQENTEQGPPFPVPKPISSLKGFTNHKRQLWFSNAVLNMEKGKVSVFNNFTIEQPSQKSHYIGFFKNKEQIALIHEETGKAKPGV